MPTFSRECEVGFTITKKDPIYMKFVPFDVMHTQIFNHEIIFDLSKCLLMSKHTVFILNDIFDKNSHFMLTQVLKPMFSVDRGFDLTKQEIPLTLKAAVYGKCKQLECLH